MPGSGPELMVRTAIDNYSFIKPNTEVLKMRNLKVMLISILIGSLSFVGCENLLNNDADSGPDKKLSKSAKGSKFVLSKQITSYKAAGVNVANVDAIFSLGWMPFYEGEEESKKILSDAFAIAINKAACDESNVEHGPFSFDMGTVSVNYEGGTIELLKSEDEYGVYYDLFGEIDDEDFTDTSMVWMPVAEIPYIPGGVYQYNATGSDQVESISLDLTVPNELVQITGPVDGSTYTSGEALTVTWLGGTAGDSVLVSIFPLFDFDEDDFEEFELEEFEEYEEEIWELGMVLVPAEDGQYTFSAEIIQKLLDYEEDTEALLVEVFSFKETIVENDNATYFGEVHIGDLVELVIAE